MTLEEEHLKPVASWPYKVGATVELKIDESFHELLPPGPALATIHEICSATMQPVLRVTIPTPSGQLLSAVLKLYDRRCGSILRSVYHTFLPHTKEDEAEYQEFVRSGDAALFARTLEEEEKKMGQLPASYEYIDEYDDDVKRPPITFNAPQSRARFETLMWMESKVCFRQETRAYHYLRDLQGDSIPHLYAVASLRLFDVGAHALPPEFCRGPLSAFFETRAILLELIPGPRLYDLPLSEISTLSANPMRTCQTITQEATDIVHEINRRGIVLNDSSPNNTIVDSRRLRPVLIDFGHCTFRDEKLYFDLHFDDEHEEPGWDPDVSYWEYADITDGPGAIGAVMVTECRLTKGMQFEIAFPDGTKILEDVKNKVSQWTPDGYNVKKHVLYSDCMHGSTKIHATLA